MRLFYYPGCASQHLARDLHQAVEALFSALELEIAPLEDWNCCGAREVAGESPLVGLLLAARNLALVQEGRLIVTCSLCYHNLKLAEKELSRDRESLRQLNDLLAEEGLSYSPDSVRVSHLLEFLCEKDNLSRLVSEVKRSGLRTPVAPFYGCFLSRPFGLEAGLMEKLLDLSGFGVAANPLKHHCCGGHLPRTDSPVIKELCGRLIYSAGRAGARFLGVCCPVCRLNLELYGPEEGPRVLYVPQLLGLKLGLPPAALGLEDGEL